jgi:hypothetical protein
VPLMAGTAMPAKHGRDTEESEARHRAMLMAHYSTNLRLERLCKPTTRSVESGGTRREKGGCWGYKTENRISVKGVLF